MQAKSLARTLLAGAHNSNATRCPSGKYIRRLHIASETPILERCSPINLRTILDHTPYLCMYSDYHSAQRSLFSESTNTRCSSEEILKLVARP